MLRNTNLLILDESTSALDGETESIIQASLRELCRNKTCIIAAHRLSTVIEADNIVLLEHGKIIAQGKHEYLL